MKEKKIERNLKDLSVKQQIGLYVLLKRMYTKKNKPFYSSDFAKEMDRFLNIKNQEEFRKIIGGILGALSKNNILERKSGDRDPLWIINKEIQSKPDYYLKQLDHIPHVTTHWPQS